MWDGSVRARIVGAIVMPLVLLVFSACALAPYLKRVPYEYEWVEIPQVPIAINSQLTQPEEGAFPTDLYLEYSQIVVSEELIEEALERGGTEICLVLWFPDIYISYIGVDPGWKETNALMRPFPGGDFCLRYASDSNMLRFVVDGVPAGEPWLYDGTSTYGRPLPSIDHTERLFLGMLDRAYFFFPLDEITIESHFFFVASVRDASGREVERLELVPWETLDVDMPGWEIAERVHDGPLPSVTLRRPSATRAFVIPLAISLLLAPAIVLMAESVAGAGGIAFAFFLGLYVVRNSILPVPPDTPLLLDKVIVIDYALVAASLSLALLTRGPWRGTSPKDRLVGLPGSHVYHDSSCPILLTKKDDAIVRFVDESAALASGRRACLVCNGTRNRGSSPKG
jgi:hypothetical protein